MLSSARRTKSARSRKRTAGCPAESRYELGLQLPHCVSALHRAARRQYGLLEKKKDYKLRADDFHKKEAALRHLRRKAEERNPDEFYFAMQGAQTRGGVHTKRCAAVILSALPWHACLRLLHTLLMSICLNTCKLSSSTVVWCRAAQRRPTSTHRRSCG